MIITIDDIYMFLPSRFVEPDVWDHFDWMKELKEVGNGKAE